MKNKDSKKLHQAEKLREDIKYLEPRSESYQKILFPRRSKSSEKQKFMRTKVKWGTIFEKFSMNSS